jgi:hypothetical protein
MALQHQAFVALGICFRRKIGVVEVSLALPLKPMLWRFSKRQHKKDVEKIHVISRASAEKSMFRHSRSSTSFARGSCFRTTKKNPQLYPHQIHANNNASFCLNGLLAINLKIAIESDTFFAMLLLRRRYPKVDFVPTTSLLFAGASAHEGNVRFQRIWFRVGYLILLTWMRGALESKRIGNF